MKEVSEASKAQLAAMTRYARTDTMRALQGGEMQVMRVLTELCAGHLEAYQPGGPDGDASYVGAMLAGKQGDGILDVEISGTGDEPVIAIKLLPVEYVPFVADVEDRWGPGEPGHRARRVEWRFRWGNGQERTIVYDLAPNGDGLSWGMEPRKTAALMLARIAGWPLPDTAT